MAEGQLCYCDSCDCETRDECRQTCGANNQCDCCEDQYWLLQEDLN